MTLLDNCRNFVFRTIVIPNPQPIAILSNPSNLLTEMFCGAVGVTDGADAIGDDGKLEERVCVHEGFYKSFCGFGM